MIFNPPVMFTIKSSVALIKNLRNQRLIRPDVTTLIGCTNTIAFDNRSKAEASFPFHVLHRLER